MEIFTAKSRIDDKENITVSRHMHSQEKINQHTHDFIEIEYVFSGNGVQVINGKQYSINRGTLLFFNFGDVHSYYTEDELGIINCLLNPEFVNEDLINSENAMDILTISAFKEFSSEISGIPQIITLRGNEFIEVDMLMKTILDEFDNKSTGYMTVLKSYINILLVKYFREISNNQYRHVYNHIKTIAPEIITYIEDNYKRKITLKELASISYYNPTYFSKIFKECIGKNVTDYINEKRILAAMKYLQETNSTVEEIGFKVGFNDKKNFYCNFKSYTGLTPNQYRKNSKK